ncbi:MAG: 30S ribosomal protein S12 methylthiotransferase RimO [Firmicutes bacterium]|nr:30S ribosomal protein S12 methylthiotransferase RimO [Bacillota bacterium]
MTVYLESLGCSKNLVDSEVMLGLLVGSGCRITFDPGEADAIVVNTCGFVSDAQRESINTILELGLQKKTGRARALVVAGCLAQRFEDELRREIPEIDVLVGTGEFYRIAEVLSNTLSGTNQRYVAEPAFIYDHRSPRIISTPGHYAYLKVADGCDNRCSFCAIPSIRGAYRSRDMDSVVLEAQRLAGQGAKELILIAQDTSRYGEDRYGRYMLPELLRRICEVPEVSWVRWLYGYPGRISDELIRAMSEEAKVCPYVDLPLQHAAPQVLRRMNRPSDQGKMLRLIEKLRREIPDLALRTTFMVGFPGETDSDFSLLQDFVAEVGFDRMGVFKYSPEVGTPAYIIEGEVPEEIKEIRYDALMRQQQEISMRLNQRLIGREFDVLVEGSEDGRLYGRSAREAPEIDGLIYFDDRPECGWRIGDMIKVRITAADFYDLSGEGKP